MARTGMKLEDIFRAKYSLKKEDDLFQLIEAAITVAVSEKKAEFRERKARIAEILNSEGPVDEVFSSPGDSDGELPRTSPAGLVSAADHRSVTSGDGFQENKNSENVVRENNNNKRGGIQEKQRPKIERLDREKKGSGIDEKKYSVSERKLEQRYRDLEKRKRKIQVLEIKDAPKFENSCRFPKKFRF